MFSVLAAVPRLQWSWKNDGKIYPPFYSNRTLVSRAQFEQRNLIMNEHNQNTCTFRLEKQWNYLIQNIQNTDKAEIKPLSNSLNMYNLSLNSSWRWSKIPQYFYHKKAQLICKRRERVNKNKTNVFPILIDY